MTVSASPQTISDLKKHDPRTEFLKEYIELCRKYDCHITRESLPNLGIINELCCGMNTIDGFTFSFIQHNFDPNTGRMNKISMYRAKKREWVPWIVVDTSDDTPADWVVELQEKLENDGKPE